MSIRHTVRMAGAILMALLFLIKFFFDYKSWPPIIAIPLEVISMVMFICELISIPADVDDEKLNKALNRYHCEGKTSNIEIKELLKLELDYDLRCAYCDFLSLVLMIYIYSISTIKR